MCAGDDARAPPPPGAGGAGRAASRGDPPGGIALLLSHEGAFLRSILVDELSKGLDAAVRLSFDSVSAAVRAALAPPPPVAAAAAAAAPPPPPGRPAAAAGAAACPAEVPRLADETDVAQVEGLQRLAALMQQLADSRAAADNNGGAAGAAPPPQPPPPGASPDTATALRSAAAILTWSATEAAKLPRAQQVVLLQLPLDVMARLTSRAAARALRLLISEQDLPRAANNRTV